MIPRRPFGARGRSLPVLGFGGSRYPTKTCHGKVFVDQDLLAQLVDRALQSGIDLFDCAWNYSDTQAERALGVALAGRRDRVLISSKAPMWVVHSKADYWRYLERSLRELNTDWLDFYSFHNLSADSLEVFEREHLFDEAVKAREKGLIRMIGFSTHGEASFASRLLAKYPFEVVTLIYNLINRKNEDVLREARERGVATLTMGSAGGGFLSLEGADWTARLGGTARSAAEASLRLVLGNRDVSCALSGMDSMSVLEQNARTAERVAEWEETWQELAMKSQELMGESRVGCISCDYCLHSCPIRIMPGTVFRAYDRYKVWGLEEAARVQYARFGNGVTSERPEMCTGCGECVKVCPQNLEIPELLKTVDEELRALQAKKGAGS